MPTLNSNATSVVSMCGPRLLWKKNLSRGQGRARRQAFTKKAKLEVAQRWFQHTLTGQRHCSARSPLVGQKETQFAGNHFASATVPPTPAYLCTAGNRDARNNTLDDAVEGVSRILWQK